MALTHHDATHGDQGRGSYTVLFSAQHGGDDNVATCAQTTIGPQRHLIAQIVQRQNLVCFSQSKLPRQACEFHRCLWAGARSAIVAGDQDDISFCFCHTGGDCADA